MNAFITFVGATVLALSLVAQDPVPAPAPAPKAGGIPDCQDVVTTASGLQYCVLKEGRTDAAAPTVKDMVEVNYTGWFPDGRKFDSSFDTGKPAKFPVTGVVKGWTEALLLMKPGARFKLIVPPALGYGSAQRGPIPGDSTLVFEVELLRVLPLPQFPAAAAEQKDLPCGARYATIKAGTGEPPASGDGVSVRFAVFNDKGDLEFCSEMRDDFRLGGTCESHRHVFLREIVSMLRLGEVVRIEVPGKLLNQGGAPGPDTVWRVEVANICKVPAFAMPAADKLTRTDSGLQYEVITAGTGKRPTRANKVRAMYTGWLMDGTIFDSSHQRAQPSEFALTEVIAGWTEGLQLMQEGGICKFLIPAELAYGAQAKGNIPPNSKLLFQVELLEVQ